MLVVENLSKKFKQDDILKAYKKEFWHGPVWSVKNLSFSVKKGEIYGFLGPNGAGKTTAIKCILGLLKPDSGIITLDGGDIKNFNVRKRVGYLPENPYYYDYLTAYEIVEYLGHLSGVKGSELKLRTNYYLEKVGLKDKKYVRLRNFSKGMVQRTGLACAIISRPDFLIFDEPMTGLDPVGRKDFRDMFVELKQQGCTILFSTHILADVELLASRLLIINKGEKVIEDSLINIMEQGTGDYEVVVNSKVNEIPVKGCRVEVSDKYTKVIVSEFAKKDFLMFVCENNLDISSLNRDQSNLEDIFSDIINKIGDKK